jgi:hypothetical protein
MPSHPERVRRDCLAQIDKLHAEIRQVIAWADEQRNGPKFTTLGMVQEKLRELLPEGR